MTTGASPAGPHNLGCTRSSAHPRGGTSMIASTTFQWRCSISQQPLKIAKVVLKTSALSVPPTCLSVDLTERQALDHSITHHRLRCRFCRADWPHQKEFFATRGGWGVGGQNSSAPRERNHPRMQFL